jgi:hypothetical protein
MDVEISALSFGGWAFEPLTQAGRTWIADVTARNPDYPFFQASDGCMCGFPVGSIGFEPKDFDAFFDDMQDAGIKSNICQHDYVRLPGYSLGCVTYSCSRCGDEYEKDIL